MCCLLVSGFLTEITQQIHSLRASGVISSHFARAAGSEMRTSRKSAGTPCTAPGEIAFFAMDFILDGYAISWGSSGLSELSRREDKLIWTSVLFGLSSKGQSAIPSLATLEQSIPDTRLPSLARDLSLGRSAAFALVGRPATGQFEVCQSQPTLKPARSPRLNVIRTFAEYAACP